jgi:hypothetical protein
MLDNPFTRAELLAVYRMALTALSDDSVRVPREPTEEMIRAAKSVWGISALNLREIWKAMLAASDKGAG